MDRRLPRRNARDARVNGKGSHPMSANPAVVIAETFSSNVTDIREYRYQPGQTKQAIFAIGNVYYTVSSGEPKDKEYAWEKAPDQWSAERHGTVLWVAKSE
jgi:hypothetical protein